MPGWRERVALIEQMPALERRESGGVWTDCEVFEALVLAVLTNSVDWSKIQRIRHDLKDCSCAFDPVAYANLNPHEVETRILPWFKERKAGALTHRRSFNLFIEAAGQLTAKVKDHGTIEAYIEALYESCGRQSVVLAVLLGSEKKHKLRGIGIPLAAEFLKSLGYDVAKPDRHICRAVGTFGWVEFKSWPDRSGNKTPGPSEKEMVDVMRVLESLAASVGQRTVFVDNALWLLCAQSGLRFTNEELKSLSSIAGDGMNSRKDEAISANASHIAPERADRFTRGPGDVVWVSKEESERMLDRMHGQWNRPGVDGFMG